MSYKPLEEKCLGKLIGANFNSTSDQAIPINSAGWLPTRIRVTNPSTSLTTAAGGVYTSTSKGGTAIVAASQVYTDLTAAAKVLDLTLAVADKETAATIYLSLTTAQGGAATADVYVYGITLTP